MSPRDNMKRIYVGNLPLDVRTRDLEDLFYKFGKIAFIDLKTRRGPPFAFVEFHDYRDAEEAVRCRDGKRFDGCRLRVEFPRGRERPSRFKNGSGRSTVAQRRSKFRVKVTGLPSSGSWQDLKDHMREVGEVCFADVFKGGEGVVEFVNYDDMRYAIEKLNNTKFKSHEGESSYIKLREDVRSGDSRSRSRSPVNRSRSRLKSRSRSRSPVYDKSPARSHSRSASGGSRSRSRSPRRSKSRSRSRSPVYDKSPARSHRRSASKDSRSRSRSPRTSKSRSPVYNKSTARSHSRSASKDSRSRSRSPRTSKSRSRSRSQSRSAERN